MMLTLPVFLISRPTTVTPSTHIIASLKLHITARNNQRRSRLNVIAKKILCGLALEVFSHEIWAPVGGCDELMTDFIVYLTI